jgi:hypothetical protein
MEEVRPRQEGRFQNGRLLSLLTRARRLQGVEVRLLDSAIGGGRGQARAFRPSRYPYKISVMGASAA